MDARTGYTDGMTQRESTGGVLVRAVAYVRVSSEEQRRHGYSLDDQEGELRIQIGSRDWELVEVVRDEGLSGADPSRPGLRRIEELAQEGRVDVALATKHNRWFRDIEHRRRYERGLRRMGARIAALNDSGNTIAVGVDDLIGEEPRREIARETRRGRRARATKGEVVAGSAPFGFRFTPDRKKRTSGSRSKRRPSYARFSRSSMRATSKPPWRSRPRTQRASGGSPDEGWRGSTRRREDAASSGTTPRRSTSRSPYRIGCASRAGR